MIYEEQALNSLGLLFQVNSIHIQNCLIVVSNSMYGSICTKAVEDSKVHYNGRS